MFSIDLKRMNPMTFDSEDRLKTTSQVDSFGIHKKS